MKDIRTAEDILNDYPFDMSDPSKKWYEEDDVLLAMKEYARQFINKNE